MKIEISHKKREPLIIDTNDKLIDVLDKICEYELFVALMLCLDNPRKGGSYKDWKAKALF